MTPFQYILSVAYHAFKEKLELIKAMESPTGEDIEKLRALRKWMKRLVAIYKTTTPEAEAEDSDPPPPGGGEPPIPPPKP